MMQETNVRWTMYFIRCWRKNPDDSSSTETDSDKDPESPCRSSKRQAANIKEAAKLKRRANRKQNEEDFESSKNSDSKNTADTKKIKNLSIRFLVISYVQDVLAE